MTADRSENVIVCGTCDRGCVASGEVFCVGGAHGTVLIGKEERAVLHRCLDTTQVDEDEAMKLAAIRYGWEG